jgi:serine protease Do
MMKRLFGTLGIAILGGVVAVGALHLIKGDEPVTVIETIKKAPPSNYTAMAINPALDFTMAAERTVNAVVHVKTESTRQPTSGNPWMDMFGYEMEPQVQQGSGSGVIISQNGYIVTNNHVIDGAQSISISMNNNKTYNAKVVGADPSTDIALLKIEETNLPTVTFGDSDALKIGEWVLAVGNPFDLTSTVTAGIVSAKARNINLLRGDNSRDFFPIESFIQTDAAVNPGNSGGALVNISGQLVGINTAIASRTGSYSGYSFAVPASIVQKVTADLREFGMVQRAFIGVRISDVNQELADKLDLPGIAGIYVNDLVADGAAASAGIEAGDVILKVGVTDVKTVPELQEQISRYRPGDSVGLQIWRDGSSKSLELVLRNKEGGTDLKNIEEIKSSMLLGATIANITDEEKEKLKIHGGAKIIDLTAGKLKDIGVTKGFIVTKIDGEKIYDLKSFSDVLAEKSGGVLIEGVYPNGQKAYYGLGI